MAYYQKKWVSDSNPEASFFIYDTHAERQTTQDSPDHIEIGDLAYEKDTKALYQLTAVLAPFSILQWLPLGRVTGGLNVGISGVGVCEQTGGLSVGNLSFHKLTAGSSKMTVTLDSGNGVIVFDIPANTFDDYGAAAAAQTAAEAYADSGDAAVLASAQSYADSAVATHAGLTDPHPNFSRMFVPLVANALTYTNAPSGGLEVFTNGGSQAVADLRGAQKVTAQVSFSVIPHSTGQVKIMYSTNGGSSWAELLAMGTGIYVANQLAFVTGTVPSSAKVKDCLLSLVVTGNGQADPVLQKAGVAFNPA